MYCGVDTTSFPCCLETTRFEPRLGSILSSGRCDARYLSTGTAGRWPRGLCDLSSRGHVPAMTWRVPTQGTWRRGCADVAVRVDPVEGHRESGGQHPQRAGSWSIDSGPRRALLVCSIVQQDDSRRDFQPFDPAVGVAGVIFARWPLVGLTTQFVRLIRVRSGWRELAPAITWSRSAQRRRRYPL